MTRIPPILLPLLFLLPLFFSLSLSALPLPEVPDGAFAEDAFDRGDPRVEKRLLIDHQEARPGETIAFGVLFSMDPGWHIYWINSGQGGMETEAILSVSPGLVTSLRWPAPKVYHEAGGAIITFGYSNTVLLFSEMEIPADADSSIELKADVDYLVCEVDCIPGRASLTRTLPLTDGESKPAGPQVQHFFDRARETLPLGPDEAGVHLELRYSHVPISNPDQFRVELSIIACEEEGEPDCLQLGPPPERPADAFVFERIDTVRLDVARVSPHPTAHSGWFIELSGRTTRDNHDGQHELRGVLLLQTAEGDALPVQLEALFPWEDTEEARALAMDAAAPSDAPGPSLTDSEPGAPSEQGLSLFYVLLLAFLGGALLNLMPCVFPVLAIKVFSFVSVVHEERGSIYLHSFSYTAGIVASMMVLAAAVIALQLLGTQVGWGFQFQEPIFIAVVGAVLVVFALNLFGVFEVTVSPGKLQNVAVAPPSHRRSFGEGVLAVVLATPCSAPFLGTAVGFALAGAPWVIALIFFVLGLGLAIPFVLLTLIPGAAKILPRPGAWMNHFKQFLGFALLGAAIWLLWLIGQMVGPNAVIRLLAFFLACALASWLFGLVQFRSSKARALGALSAAALIAASAYFTLHFDDSPPPAGAASASSDGPISWIPWEPDAVESALSEGRPVFIDFTADWCITCQVNKANVLEHPRVVEAIEEHQVAMFIADWTRRDERIRSKLAEFGKAGVPMYLLYSPEAPDSPQVLPELLTRDMIVSAFQDAAP